MKAHDPMLRVRHRTDPIGTGSLRTGRAAAEIRILSVLATPRGTVPWRPEFGCDVQDLVGSPAHPAVLNEAEWRVREAVARWLPDVRVRECHATAAPRGAAVRQPRAHVEVGLLALGGEARLQISLVVEVDGAPLGLELELL